MRGGGGGPNRQGGRGRGRGGGRGGGGGGGGGQRWWDPQWRAEKLKQMRAERAPDVPFNDDEWIDKLEALKGHNDTQEIVVRENIGRSGGERLEQLASQAGLYFHSYNKGINTVYVVSKVPLPNYRADLDVKHGSRQSEIQMSADTALRVGHMLASFRDSESASSVSNRNIEPKNELNPSSTQSTVIQIDELDATKFDKMKLSQELHDKQQRLQRTELYRSMLSFREKLPAYNMKSQLIEAICKNQVLVVSGETGCGKTTQLPQFILENEINYERGADCNIICTQPRRISAISVASRVASERGENLGETVGYQIRLESKRSENTRLLFCTTGILIRRLVQDPNLSGVSHVLVDEIHERGMNEDFLIIILRDLLPRRPDLRLVLMSATINAELFSKYFDDAPMVHIPGFTFPVTQFYLEDVLEKTGYRVSPENGGARSSYQHRRTKDKKDPLSDLFQETDIENVYQVYSRATKQSLQAWDTDKIDLGLVEACIEYICRHEDPGAILVFLTGWDEISKLLDILRGNAYVGDANKFLVIPLHGSLPTVNQQEIFQRPPTGMRKIVLATNIAETSITIDDVVYVIDCGKAKETSYDALNKLACLLPSWISKASALQRKGRAGRVQPGTCYHLYPRIIYEAMLQYQLPEILRTPLQELSLQIKNLQLGRIGEFLAKALQPPEPLAVQNAIDLLVTIGALNENEELTPLGSHLSTLPVDPRIGKMLLMGSIFQCLGPALTIAAALGHKDPFVLPIDRKEAADEAKRRFAGDSYSDHIALLRAFEGWQVAKRENRDKQYCWQNYLSSPALGMMESMRFQFLDLLSDIGFYDSSRGVQVYNKFSANMDMVRSVLCAGLFPSIVQIKRRGKRVVCYTKEDGNVDLHPASVNSRVGGFPYPWLIYSEKVKTTGIFIRDSSNISNYAVLMFGGSLSPNKNGDGVEMLGGYLQFSATKRVAKLIQELRKELDGLLLRKIEQPKLDIQEEGKAIVNAVLELLGSESSQRTDGYRR